MKETKVLLESSLMALGFAIQEAIQDGWEIDPDMPLTQVWTQYECGFVRHSDFASDNTTSDTPDSSVVEKKEDAVTSLFKTVNEEAPQPARRGRPAKGK